MPTDFNAPSPIDRLIFIYNADGGVTQGVIDAVHKLVSPNTYPCSLCAITYGALRMDPKWRAWLTALPMPTMFLHKDEVARALPDLDIALPAVVVERGGVREVLIPTATLDRLDSVDALIAELERRL